MISTRDRILGMLPGILGGVAGIAQGQGWLGSGQQTAANNDIWARLGQGRLPDGSVNTAMTGAPMQLPGASMGGGVPTPPTRPTLPAQASPNALAHAFGLGINGGPPGLSLAGPRMSSSPTLPMMAQQPMDQMPQMQQQPGQPVQITGLLGADPNEQTRRTFLQQQGIGSQYGAR